MSRKILASFGAVLVTAGLALAPIGGPAHARSAASSSARAAAVPTPPPLSWGKCTGDKRLKQAKAECALLTVPLDYANPAAGTIQVSVSRIVHTEEPFKGAVFTNPGGPGGAGRIYSILGGFVPKKAGLNYDWYGVDPRGVGTSVPALSCDPSFGGWNRKPYVPKTADISNYWIAKTANYATACGNSAAKALLPHLKTTDNVNDFESLRLAIGQPQITWYGFSYGTYIGQVYASTYPTSIKAMILDGVVDPTRVWYPANLDQEYAFEKTIDAFFKWAAKYDSVYHLGKTQKKVRKLYFKTEKKLTKKPAYKGRIGPSEFDDAIVQAGYYNPAWVDVAGAWSKLLAGNGKPIADIYGYDPKDPQADNGYAMYLATQCTDTAWPTDQNQYFSDANAIYQQAKYLTWNNTWYNLACRTWPAPPAASKPVVNGTFTGPVLLTAETYDAATPFSGALVARSIFTNSALVEGKGGTSHAVSLSGVPCVDDSIVALLKKGTLPTRKAGNVSDLKCRGLRPPVPQTGEEEGAGRYAAFPARLPNPFH